MKIYWIKAQAPLRVLALVKHLGIDTEFVEADLMAGELKSAAYARINPNMKVPTLVDGDYVLQLVNNALARGPVFVDMSAISWVCPMTKC